MKNLNLKQKELGGVVFKRIAPITSNQTRYKTEKGEVSILYINSGGCESWDLSCVIGSLFDGVERYRSKESLDKRIKGMLG